MDDSVLDLTNSLKLNETDETTLNLLKDYCENGLNLDGTDHVRSLLNSENSQIIKLSTELVANLAKTEHNRTLLSKKNIINSLLNLLESDENILINAVRALGNICYENETAAEILYNDGFDRILKLFYSLNDDKLQLKLKISGLLLNMFICKENLEIDHCRLMKHISTILKKGASIVNEEDITLHTYLLQIIYSIMVENEDAEYSEDLLEKIVNIFINVNKPELELLCLQILFIASEKDVKLLLAKSNVCEKVIELIEKYKGFVDDEESKSVMKMACDLINNILIEDASMALLYDEGNGEVYKKCIEWLDSGNEDLLSTAVLAVGNFARNDKNCVEIVKSNISKKLIALLTKYSRKNLNTKVIHGVLSTLKNLVVPSINKSIILNEGLIESIQPILETDQDIIVFKLLGMLRLIVDGQGKNYFNSRLDYMPFSLEQAAMKLTSQRFLEKCIQWYENTIHLSLKREISRLLVWLIKNCHSSESMQVVLETKGTIPCLISMFSSENVIMENEAIISLILLLTALKTKDELEKELIECEIATVLPYVRIFSHDKKVLENVTNLLELLVQSEKLLKHFKDRKVFQTIKQLYESKNISNDKVQKVLTSLSR